MGNKLSLELVKIEIAIANLSTQVQFGVQATQNKKCLYLFTTSVSYTCSTPLTVGMEPID